MPLIKKDIKKKRQNGKTAEKLVTVKFENAFAVDKERADSDNCFIM